jgi:hypothetical protein
VWLIERFLMGLALIAPSLFALIRWSDRAPVEIVVAKHVESPRFCRRVAPGRDSSPPLGWAARLGRSCLKSFVRDSNSVRCFRNIG